MTGRNVGGLEGNSTSSETLGKLRVGHRAASDILYPCKKYRLGILHTMSVFYMHLQNRK